MEKPVYRVWLSDGTAIIEMSFWSALAEQVRNELRGRRNSFEANEMVVMLVKKFAVGRDPRAWLCPQRRLTASDTSSVEIREATTEESACLMEGALDETLYLEHYEKLQTPGPFLCNLIGIVHNLSDVFAAQDGTAMLAFELFSPQNEMVECKAYGWTADSNTLVEGHKVAIQTMQSRQGLKGERGRLWVYDDSVIVVLGENCLLSSTGSSPVTLTFGGA